MEVGDTVMVTHLASTYYGRLTYVERYKGAYIVQWALGPQHEKLINAAVFPEIPQFPPAGFFTKGLYIGVAQFHWEDNSWNMPLPPQVKRSMGGIKDPREIIRRRVELIHDMMRQWGKMEAWEIVPGNEWEMEQWRKLPQNKGV